MKGVGDVLIDNGNRGSDSYLLFTAIEPKYINVLKRTPLLGND